MKNHESLETVTHTNTFIERKKGITLVALVITIVVLIILAAVVINLSLGNNGIFNRAKTAKEMYANAQASEQTEIDDAFSKLLVASDGTVTANASELKTLMLDIAYPVGSIYISTSDTDPSKTLGGEWEKFAQGRTLIGDGTSTEDTNNETKSFTTGNTGGEYNHQLTVAEMPSHKHDYNDNWLEGGSSYGWAGGKWWYGISDHESESESTGGDQSHNNIQPYIVTYMWKRTK